METKKSSVVRDVGLVVLGAAVLAKEKIEDIIEILKEKGKANEEEAKNSARRLFEKGRKLKENFGDDVLAEVYKLAAKVEKTTRPREPKN
jgi:polyhydroxyalkanoate synthesis regulator phasin